MPAIEFNPYSYDMHEDPYPTYQRCARTRRCIATRRSASGRCRATTTCSPRSRTRCTFSNAQGVSLERSSQAQASAMASFLAMDPPRHDQMRGAGVARLHAAAGRRSRAAHPRAHRALHRRASLRAGRCDIIQDFAAKLPMDVVSELLGVPRGRPRRAARAGPTRSCTARTASADDPADGDTGEPAADAATSATWWRERQQAPRHRSGERVARRRDRRRAPGRPRGHRVPLPDDHRRQRDDHEADRQRALLAVEAPAASANGCAASPASSRTGSRKRCATTARRRCWRAR